MSPAESPDRVGLGEAFKALHVEPPQLEEGETLTFAFILYRTADGDGDASWGFRTTGAPNREELLGALQIQVELVKRGLLEDWDVE